MASKPRVAGQHASSPASICPRFAAATPKFCRAYHLLLDCEQLRTSLLDTPTAKVPLRGCAQKREAWTDVGADGVGRRPDLTLFDNNRQI